jgi:anti-anti-sigma regulatory factor
MATNLRITVHRNSENLHLKLMGDFDGNSAYELLDAIRTQSQHSSRIFIHTDGLKAIEPFGLDVFHSHFDLLKGKSMEFVFAGKNAATFAPDESSLFDLSISTIPDAAQVSLQGHHHLSLWEQGGGSLL